jgi:electron transfer flavoprotein beta subunit
MSGNTATLEREIEGGKEIVEVNAVRGFLPAAPSCEPQTSTCVAS